MFDKIKKLRTLISLGVIGPLVFYPFVFCPFRLPYLYCSICHLKCVWGRYRWFLLLGILGLNLRKKFYCSSLCPCGTIQDLEHKAKTKKFILPLWSRHIRYFILGLVIAFMLAIGRGYFSSFVSDQVFWGAVGIVFVVSFFIHRFWCLLFCPTWALSDIVLKVKKFLAKKTMPRNYE